MVDVKEDEIEEAIIYLRQHLQGEIGTWKENDVKEKLKDWRIEKIRLMIQNLEKLL